jgi:hypothetical protein
MSVLKAAARTHYNSREQVNPFSISGAIGRFESTHTHISVCECDVSSALHAFFSLQQSGAEARTLPHVLFTRWITAQNKPLGTWWS